MRLLLSLAVAAVCLAVAQAWRLPASRSMKVPATIVSSFFLLGGPLDLATHGLSSSSPVQLVAPAHADFRAAQKRTYFRYTPKFLEGGEFLKSAADAAVDKEDWAAVKKLFEVYPTKMNGSQKDQVDTTDTYVNSHFYRPMTLLAGSFAERGSSEKQRALMDQEVAVKASLDSLSASVLERRGEGLFAGAWGCLNFPVLSLLYFGLFSFTSSAADHKSDPRPLPSPPSIICPPHSPAAACRHGAAAHGSRTQDSSQDRHRRSQGARPFPSSLFALCYHLFCFLFLLIFHLLFFFF